MQQFHPYQIKVVVTLNLTSTVRSPSATVGRLFLPAFADATVFFRAHLAVSAKLGKSVLSPFCFSLMLFKMALFGTLVSFQSSSVTQSCLTLCDPMDCSTPDFSVHHQLPEFTQTHVHGVGDAIQPPHPLLSPSPPAPNPSQHQNLFQ